MKLIGRLSLIIAVLLCSVSLGAARGQVRMGEQVILCSGTAVRVHLVESDTGADRRVLICPDMALALLDAVAAPALALPARDWRSEAMPRAAISSCAGPTLFPSQARGPPTA